MEYPIGNLKIQWLLDGYPIGVSADGGTIIDGSPNGFDGTITGAIGVASPYQSLPIFQLTEDYNFEISPRLGEDFIVEDSIIVKDGDRALIVDSFILNDNVQIETFFNIKSAFTLSDEIEIFVPARFVNLEETFILGSDPNILISKTIKFASRIISINPLVVITDANPVDIIKIDTTDPQNPISTIYPINGSGENVKNAKDIVYNSTLDIFYIACADGQILEVMGSDFTMRTQHDTGDTDDLLQIANLEGFNKTYVGTEDLEGEIIVMDQSEIESLGLDIRFIQEIQKSIGLSINTLDAIGIGTDIRFLAETFKNVGLDIRFFPQTNNPFPTIGAPANPLSREDFHVYINNVEIPDAILSSIIITHNIDEKSTASFNLNRKHDQLNHYLDGTPSEITNNNNVKIYIKTVLEFEGEIDNIQCESDTESVNVSTTGNTHSDDRKTVTLSLPEIDEQLHIYHALINNPSIYNPIIDVDDENPELAKGIKVNLGNYQAQHVTIHSDTDDELQRIGEKTLAEQIMEGDWQPKQNWTYFWTILLATNFETGEEVINKYVGTSLAGFTTDMWFLESLKYQRQRRFPGESTTNIPSYAHPSGGLGIIDIEKIKIRDEYEYTTYYKIGEAPFKEISTTNGKFITALRYEDKPDGLYRSFDVGYNYLQYATEVADLEYEKLKTINGNILPKTTTNIELFIDGYYHYGISLLTRLNMDNTTTPSIYNNNNGFPISVKAIQINASNMRVVLSTDNSLSVLELLEIDENLPDVDSDEYIFGGVSGRVAIKYDPADSSFPE